MEVIRSKSNSAVKAAKKLHQRKYRTQSYLIEGWHLFEEAVAAGAVIEQIFAVEGHQERLIGFSQVKWVSLEILQDLADSPSPQGIVAQLALPSQSLPEEWTGQYLVLEDVQDPGNVGTMIRTADAAGCAGVFISSHTADIYNLKTLRSMQGSHFHLPVYRLPMAEIVAQLKEKGVQLIGTTLSGESVDYKTIAPMDAFALIMGNEGKGISAETAQDADVLAHITMPGQAESLNVAVAAGIMLFSLV